MLQKLLVNNFEWIEDACQFNDDFIKKNYNNLHYKTEYVKRIRNLKQALNDGLVLKKNS